MKHCAPGREKETISCYSHNSLIKIAGAYNEICPKNKKIRTTNKNKLQLWNEIRKALSNKCKNNEICWMEQDFIKNLNNEEISKETFRPKMPEEWKKDMTIWLTTDDINDVMKQYEKKYKDFLYIGTVPLECGVNKNLSCELTNFNIKKLYKNGIRKIGMVLNTDYSYQSGSHWQAIYIDMDKKNINFYDSYADKPLNETKELLEKFKKQLKKIGINAKIQRNKKRHQYDGYSCGMYSMYFIILQLLGYSLKDIEKMNLTTKKMQKLKKYLYRP